MKDPKSQDDQSESKDDASSPERKLSIDSGLQQNFKNMTEDLKYGKLKDSDDKYKDEVNDFEAGTDKKNNSVMEYESDKVTIVTEKPEVNRGQTVRGQGKS